jgi:hypothetical protein
LDSTPQSNGAAETRPPPPVAAHSSGNQREPNNDCNRACPSKTPEAIKSIAIQNVPEIASPRQKCAHSIVLNGIKLLNKYTLLVVHRRNA